MKRLLYIGGLVFLFVSLTGATLTNAPVEFTQTKKVMPIPKKVKSPNPLNSAEAIPTNEPVEITKEKKLPIIPKIIESPNPLTSGGSGVKGIPIYSKGPHTTLDSFDLLYTNNTGNEWNGRYIYYINNATGPSDSSRIVVFDPEDGSTFDSWDLPFPGYCMGLAFVKNAMYVSCWSDGTIKKVNPSTHALIASYSAPGGTSVRGVSSDGTYLYVGVAGSADSLYKTDTLMNVIDSWYIGSFCDWVMDIALLTNPIAITAPTNGKSHWSIVEPFSGSKTRIVEESPLLASTIYMYLPFHSLPLFWVFIRSKLSRAV
ncbi:hypothetical protein ES703_24960 [subsurface metagenome]